MSKSPVENYLTCLHRSKLVTKDQLYKVLDDIKHESNGAPVRLQDVAQRFEAEGLVTSWQNEKLLKGRHHGFFLGNYKLLRHIAAGGMSNVYLAQHVQMQRQVAIKVLPPSLTNNASYLERFYVESRAIASLDHKNIVRAYDVAREGKYHYLVLEYVDGIDLRERVETEGPLDYAKAGEYIRQAADGLAHAHKKGLIHRDIKPGNLLVDQEGVVKLLDLGLSRITHEAHSLTRAHNEHVIGTVDYLAPEQAVDSHDVDSRADIYGLGGTLYFLLTGHPPFPDGTHTERLMKHQNEEPVSILKERPGCPPELAEICKKMMAKEADDRYQTAEEVREALGDWMAGQTTAYVHPSDAEEDLSDFAAGLREEADGSHDSFDSESMSIDLPTMFGDIADSPLAAEPDDLSPPPDAAPADANLRQRLAELERRERELAEREAAFDSRRTELDERKSAVTKRATEVEAATNKLSKLDKYLEEKAGELEERATEVEKARSKLNRLEQYLEKKAGDLEKRQDELDEARTKLTELEQFLEEKAAELELKFRTIDHSSREFETTKKEVENHEANLNAREEELDEREQAIAAAQEQIAGLERREQELAQKEQELQHQHQQLQAQQQELQQEQAALTAERASLKQQAAQMSARAPEPAAAPARPKPEEASDEIELDVQARLLQRSSKDLERRWEQLDQRARELELREQKLTIREKTGGVQPAPGPPKAEPRPAAAAPAAPAAKPDSNKKSERSDAWRTGLSMSDSQLLSSDAPKVKLDKQDPAKEKTVEGPKPVSARQTVQIPKSEKEDSANMPPSELHSRLQAILGGGPAAPGKPKHEPNPASQGDALLLDMDADDDEEATDRTALLKHGDVPQGVVHIEQADSPVAQNEQPIFADPVRQARPERPPAPPAAPPAKATPAQPPPAPPAPPPPADKPLSARATIAMIPGNTPTAQPAQVAPPRQPPPAQPAPPTARPAPAPTAQAAPPPAAAPAQPAGPTPPVARPANAPGGPGSPPAQSPPGGLGAPPQPPAPPVANPASNGPPGGLRSAPPPAAPQAQGFQALPSEEDEAPRALFSDSDPDHMFKIVKDTVHGDDDSEILLPHLWPFKEPQQAEVFTTRRIAQEGQPILMVVHDTEADFAWTFLDGGLVNEEEGITVGLGDVARIDPTIGELASMPAGWQAWRASTRDPWHKAPRAK